MSFIQVFFDRLKTAKVEYVHWKSNTNIEQALDNIDDLDILVNPDHQKNLFQVFDDLNILRVYSKNDDWQKGITNYIGLDIERCQIVHIHLHFCLSLGFDYDKCFTLPIVSDYLKNRWEYKGKVFLPTVENEYCILLIRLMIKNALTPFLLLLPHAQLGVFRRAKKNGVVPENAYNEFVDLRSKISKEKLENTLSTIYAFIDKQTFLDCEETLIKNNNPWQFFKNAKRLKKELSGFKEYGEVTSFYKSFKRLYTIRIKHFFFKLKMRDNIKGKTPENGGRIFAFVGGDGAGKTTTISSVKKTLSRQLPVKIVHLGKPKRFPLGLGIGVFRKISSLFGFKDLANALIFLEVAYNRKKMFQYSCRLREKGCVVLQDRMPLKGITAMDSPRIHTIDGGRFKRLSRLEKRFYSEIKGIDFLFVLKLDPEIALKRRPEDDPDELRIRSGQVWNNKWEAPSCKEINTDENDSQQVQQIVLAKIWDNLRKSFIKTEFIGLNGTGKTTVLRALIKENSNVHISIPVKKYPFRVLKNGLTHSFKLLGMLLDGNKRNYVTPYLHCVTSLDIIRSWNRNGKIPATNFILDQGIVFQLILLLKENIITEKYCIQKLNDVAKFLPIVIKLDAPYEILWDRIKMRPAQEESRGERLDDFQSFVQFCTEYEQAYRIIGKTNLNIVNIDSSVYGPDELITEVLPYVGRK